MRKLKTFLPKLLEYIDIANKVNTYLPTRQEIAEQVFEDLGNRSREPTNLEMVANYKSYLRKFPIPIETQKQIFGVEDISFSEIQTDEIYKIILDRLEEISSAVNTLNRIAYCVTEEYLIEIENRGEYCVHALIEEQESNLSETLSTLSVRVTISNEGLLVVKTSDFFDFITQNNIEGKRIRVCLTCEKIFWADRIDKWTCSKTCGNTLRQRNWQQQNKDEYNENRRRNYAYKKNIKK